MRRSRGHPRSVYDARMDGIATATGAADERRHSIAEAEPLASDDADRLRPGVAPAGRHDAVGDPLAPPSPDAVVAVWLRHTAPPEERARAREAALRAEHAAEVAGLRAALRDMKGAHAAEIARLRAEHAAALRRVVEVHRRAPDAARADAARPGEGAAPRPVARSPARRRWIGRGLARLTRNGGGDPARPWTRLAAKPSIGADLIAAVGALRPAGAAALSRLRSTVIPPSP